MNEIIMQKMPQANLTMSSWGRTTSLSDAPEFV